MSFDSKLVRLKETSRQSLLTCPILSEFRFQTGSIKSCDPTPVQYTCNQLISFDSKLVRLKGEVEQSRLPDVRVHVSIPNWFD